MIFLQFALGYMFWILLCAFLSMLSDEAGKIFGGTTILLSLVYILPWLLYFAALGIFSIPNPIIR